MTPWDGRKQCNLYPFRRVAAFPLQQWMKVCFVFDAHKNYLMLFIDDVCLSVFHFPKSPPSSTKPTHAHVHLYVCRLMRFPCVSCMIYILSISLSDAAEARSVPRSYQSVLVIPSNSGAKEKV